MSYPDPKYFGDTGEISATYRADTHESDLMHPPGRSVDYLATGASTHGEFGLYRWNFGPESSGPGPHFHRTISESFYILSGTVQLYDGEQWMDTGPGDFLFVPQGGIHGFRNSPGERASMLLLFTPGAPREEYFETLFDIAKGKELTEAELADLFIRHDNHWV